MFRFDFEEILITTDNYPFNSLKKERQKSKIYFVIFIQAHNHSIIQQTFG